MNFTDNRQGIAFRPNAFKTVEVLSGGREVFRNENYAYLACAPCGNLRDCAVEGFVDYTTFAGKTYDTCDNAIVG